MCESRSAVNPLKMIVVLLAVIVVGGHRGASRQKTRWVLGLVSTYDLTHDDRGICSCEWCIDEKKDGKVESDNEPGVRAGGSSGERLLQLVDLQLCWLWANSKGELASDQQTWAVAKPLGAR